MRASRVLCCCVLLASWSAGAQADGRGRAPDPWNGDESGLWMGFGLGGGVITPLGGWAYRGQAHLGHRVSRFLGWAGTIAAAGTSGFEFLDLESTTFNFPHAMVGGLVDLRLSEVVSVSGGPVLAFGSLSAMGHGPGFPALDWITEANGEFSLRPGLDLRVGLFLSPSPRARRRVGLTLGLQVLMLVHPTMRLHWNVSCTRACTSRWTTQDVVTTLNPVLMLGMEWR